MTDERRRSPDATDSNSKPGDNRVIIDPRPASSRILRRAYRTFARLDVAVVLILAVLLPAVLGSCLPQIPLAAAADAERLVRWETMVRARFGALAGPLTAIGAFDVYHSPLFLAPLALLVISTLICTLERWRSVWRRAFRQPVRCSETALDTAPLTASLSASPEVALPQLAREGLERHGFRVRPASQGSLIYLRGDRNRLAPLATLVTHLAVLLLLLGVVLSWAYGWSEEVTIKPGETVEVGHESQLALRNDRFHIARYPDGAVSAYEAEVAIVVGGQEAQRGILRVNEPLASGGVGFYLRGYGGAEGRNSVTVLAARDPGYGLVTVAGFLLLLGLTVSFNCAHSWIHVRIEPEGKLRLAGRAERRAYDFGHDFAALVSELKQICMR